jgi:apolipoprotein N-acyltransferase
MELEEGPRVLIVQPNIPQDAKKLSSDPAEGEWIFNKHQAMTLRAFQDGQKRDLVVWPESVVYSGLMYLPDSQEYLGGMSFDLLRRIRKINVETGTPLLFGSEVATPEKGDDWSFTNSAILMDASGEVVYRFNKAHLVPFSETIPDLPLVGYFTQKYTGVERLLSFREGTEYNTFPIAGWRLATAICFEAAFPEIARDCARNGADILVNISNEGWFRDSAELEQMLHCLRRR